MRISRRSLFAGVAALGARALPSKAANPNFKISLAEWSFHRAIASRLMTNLDFPRVAREQFGIEGLEFVNGLWAAPTQDYVQSLKSMMQKTGTRGVMIMCDSEGAMGHSEKAARMRAAANHRKWVDIAAELGCHGIRANMHPSKEPHTPQEIDEFLKYCAESFTDLCEYAAAARMDVMIENHWGPSSNPDILLRLMKMVGRPNFGTLPDFGNFPKEVDRYEAVKRMMAYAKGVSFKCIDFDEQGNGAGMDLGRLMKTVLDAGYHSWVGIEYEGTRLPEFEGVIAAKRFLERLV